MADQPLAVFALSQNVPPLRLLRDALLTAGYPVGIGTGIAGEASDAELDSPAWETAFVRWTEPELHEVCLLERTTPGEDEEADEALAEPLHRIASLSDSAGRLIVADHLRRTRSVYLCQMLPALFDDPDHPAWGALDVVLRCLAENTEGLIYAEAEGFYDADGEMMLAETDDGSNEIGGEIEPE